MPENSKREGLAAAVTTVTSRFNFASFLQGPQDRE